MLLPLLFLSLTLSPFSTIGLEERKIKRIATQKSRFVAVEWGRFTDGPDTNRIGSQTTGFNSDRIGKSLSWIEKANKLAEVDRLRRQAGWEAVTRTIIQSPFVNETESETVLEAAATAAAAAHFVSSILIISLARQKATRRRSAVCALPGFLLLRVSVGGCVVTSGRVFYGAR